MSVINLVSNQRSLQCLKLFHMNLNLHSPYRFVNSFRRKTGKKPYASEVLTSYLQQREEPPWTSYFVEYSSVDNDQYGMSHFNWTVGNTNYHILRTGCYPYMKYHCTRRSYQDLSFEDKFFRVIKVINLGIPCLAYGIIAKLLISHSEEVQTPRGRVTIYFLMPEDRGALN